MLSLLERELRERDVPADHIIWINFEDTSYLEISDGPKLDRFVQSKMTRDGTYYVLLDEIQEAHGWEKAVNSLLAKGKADLYITGSNSRLLSSELATYLAGRYVEIQIQTLSFAEYLEFTEQITGTKPENLQTAFRKYMRLGGFPMIHTAQYDEESANVAVSGIYASVVLRDVIQRHSIRNADLLERLVMFVFENVGSIFSAKSISDFLKSENRSVAPNTIYEYMGYLEDAFVIRKVPRYDMAGKRVLKTLEKYYVSDVSLIYSVMGYKETKVAGILENVIFLELLSREYTVTIGRQGEREIDFIAEKRGNKVYVQVCRTLSGSPETIEREFTPLLAVRDQYPKYIVTQDEGWGGNLEGVKQMNIADFLLKDTY